MRSAGNVKLDVKCKYVKFIKFEDKRKINIITLLVTVINKLI